MMQGSIEEELECLVGELSTDMGEYSYYGGEYNIMPNTEDDQVLETKDKILEGNITVFKIPYSETTNPQGGKTIFIGGE